MASATTLRTSTNPAAPAADGRHVSTGRAGRGTRGDDGRDDHEQKKTAAYRPEHVQPGQREPTMPDAPSAKPISQVILVKTYFGSEIQIIVYLSVLLLVAFVAAMSSISWKSRHSECL